MAVSLAQVDGPGGGESEAFSRGDGSKTGGIGDGGGGGVTVFKGIVPDPEERPTRVAKASRSPNWAACSRAWTVSGPQVEARLIGPAFLQAVSAGPGKEEVRAEIRLSTPCPRLGWRSRLVEAWEVEKKQMRAVKGGEGCRTHLALGRAGKNHQQLPTACQGRPGAPIGAAVCMLAVMSGGEDSGWAPTPPGTGNGGGSPAALATTAKCEAVAASSESSL